MARARLTDQAYKILRVTLSGYPISRIIDKKFFYRLTKKDGFVKNVRQSEYPITRITGPKPIVRVEEGLPFRVRFTNIGIPGYSPNNVPPIGIQVIEFSNYIL
jgi:hypothetical protein